ncbi:hypothetical protein EJB05_03059 [Eragrostis curvula]|uniref:Transmembrane protein n=1 Tax=Eragrostis curvula TaxID=38414 RepID=A0A5J9WTU1_9POAL|nr:hypothetical protein EJB05_03059 [Eragrostis curvula]
MAAYATALLPRRRLQVNAPPSPFAFSSSEAVMPALRRVRLCFTQLRVCSCKMTAIGRTMAATAILALLMSSALPDAAAFGHAHTIQRDVDGSKMPGRSSDSIRVDFFPLLPDTNLPCLDEQYCKVTENHRRLKEETSNLNDSILSLMVEANNLEERAKMLEKALHQALAGEEPQVNFVVELTALRKDTENFGKSVRHHFDFQNSYYELLSSIFASHVDTLASIAKFRMRTVTFSFTVVIAASLILALVTRL